MDMRKRFSKALTLVLALTVVCTSFSFASAATATKKVVVGTPEITYVEQGSMDMIVKGISQRNLQKVQVRSRLNGRQ